MDWITAFVSHEGGIMLTLIFGGVLLFVLILLGGWGTRDLPLSGKIFLGVIAGILLLSGFIGTTSIVIDVIRDSKPEQIESHQEVLPEDIGSPEDEKDSPSYWWILWVAVGVFLLWDYFRPRKFDVFLSSLPINNKETISIEVNNRERGGANCFATIIEVKRSGKDIRREVTPHTNRLDWVGGSDDKVGIKKLDSDIGFGIILIVQREDDNIRFITAKEPHPIIGEFGQYEMIVKLQGAGSYEPKHPKSINVTFIFDKEGLKLVTKGNN